MNLGPGGKESETRKIEPTVVDPMFFKSAGFYLGEVEPEVCNRMIDEFRRAGTFLAPNVNSQNKETETDARRVEQVQVRHDLQEEIDDTLKGLMPSLSGHFKTKPSLTWFETPQCLWYKEGYYFNLHTDNSDHPDAVSTIRERKVSLSIVLNSEGIDTYRGGSLAFFMQFPPGSGKGRFLTMPSKQGSVIGFLSQLPHAVTPVTLGERFSIVTWFHNS